MLIPCCNEERRSRKVVADFQRRLPQARDLRLRQQLARPHGGRGARRRRRGARTSRCRARAMSCAACSPTSRPTSTCWSTATTPMTPPPRPAMLRLLLEQQLDMVTGGAGDRRRTAPTGPATGSATACSPAMVRGVFGNRDQRHAVGLPRLQPPLREVVSRAGRRLRDRDRIHRARAGAGDAGGRDRRRAIATVRPAPSPSCAPGRTACASCAPS